MLLMTELVHIQRTVRKAFRHGINCTPGVNQMNQNEEVNPRGKSPPPSKAGVNSRAFQKKRSPPCFVQNRANRRKTHVSGNMQKQPYFCPTIGSFWTKSRIIPLVPFTLLSNFSFLGSSLNAVKERNIKGGSGGPKLKTKIEKTGGSMGGGIPYPGVTPPRIRKTGPSSSDFFGKNNLKKFST